MNHFVSLHLASCTRKQLLLLHPTTDVDVFLLSNHFHSETIQVMTLSAPLASLRQSRLINFLHDDDLFMRSFDER